MVVPLVLSQLDYGNATLAGIPAYQHRRLQSVMNAAAKLIHRLQRYDHVTLLLHDVVCIIKERIRDKSSFSPPPLVIFDRNYMIRPLCWSKNLP